MTCRSSSSQEPIFAQLLGAGGSERQWVIAKITDPVQIQQPAFRGGLAAIETMRGRRRARPWL